MMQPAPASPMAPHRAQTGTRALGARARPKTVPRMAMKGSRTPSVSRPKSTRLWTRTANSPATQGRLDLVAAAAANELPGHAAPTADQEQTQKSQPQSMRSCSGSFSTKANRSGNGILRVR